MKDLGFSFGNNSALSIYHDGQGRDDVKAALLHFGIRGKRTPYSILKDQESRDTMKRWLLQATKVIPPMKSSDFCGFVREEFNYSINDTNGRLWMKDLGFSFHIKYEYLNYPSKWSTASSSL